MRLTHTAWPQAEAPSEDFLRDQLITDGFEPLRWRDAAGMLYQPHSHDHDESLWVIDGEITFGIGGRDYHLGAGDRLMLPAGTVHTARVGQLGCTYFIGQRTGAPANPDGR